MTKKILFPKVNGILHGGDYNPEQWLDRPDILKKDIEYMKEAGINSATLGVFSWSAYEPSEGEYNFEWIKEIINNLYENGIYTILATPSGARPAWLDEKYPEARRINSLGMREHHGGRHNHCMSSSLYRSKVKNIVTKLAEAVGNHPGVLMWHISNEFGGECFCPLCIRNFQDYLAEKFDHDIDKLNKAWWTAFWSHTYNNFSQIEPPFKDGEYSIMGLNLEWHRFTTYITTDYMKAEIATVKELTPNLPVTTNFMEMFECLDYRVLAKEIDVISWDSYPRFHSDYESLNDTFANSAFDHAMFRSMKKGTPFMLMESAPGLVNWQAYNKMKRPGIHKLFALNTLGSGADTVQYFQFRKSRGSAEQYHGAVVDHLGTNDTRVFKEVAELGALLPKLKDILGSTVNTKCALIFDWDNWWAINDSKALGQATKKYPDTCYAIFREFVKLGVDVDIISSEDNLSDYKVVIAPMLYMISDKAACSLKNFTENGGQLLATYFTGYVDKNCLTYLGGFPGNGLKDVFGIISEEIDTLFPSDRNAAVVNSDIIPEISNQEFEIRDYAEVLRIGTATPIAYYKRDYYENTPCITVNQFGKGNAYYMAARVSGKDMAEIFKKMLCDAGITYAELPDGVQMHKRQSEDGTFYFYINTSEDTKTVTSVSGKDLITGRVIEGNLTLEKYGVSVIKA